MRPPRRALRYSLGLFAAGVTLAGGLWLLGWVFRPDLSKGQPAYSPQEISAAVEARQAKFDPAHPLVLHVPVDYTQGERAPWYPKGEAPILAELVKEGKLPPVAQRVGPEPVVMRGVDGIGNYGGTWLRIANAPNDISIITWRLAGTGLARWSPHGYPIQPHLAKSITPSADRREWTVQLRRGLRWSDGEPFTADDILYYWEYDIMDQAVGAGIAPTWMRIAGQPGRIEKLDDYTIKFVFPAPYGQFLDRLATNGHVLTELPRHYLSKYHPRLGDPQFIQKEMQAFQVPSPRGLYWYAKAFDNPECPRMWPWVYRKFKPNPPQVFVRNPYYFAVDEAGNQLPYIDRVQFEIQTGPMLALSAANGQVSMQTRHIRYEDYTELMSRRKESGFHVLHWYPATRSVWVINPNVNRLVRPDQPDTQAKAQLLADRRFRQALSLALNRAEIIKAEYNDQVRPSQVAPGRESPFHDERLAQSFIAYDPAQANRLLDELGLTQRGFDGMRRFPDGAPMTFYLTFTPFTGAGPAQFVVDDWAAVGVRCIMKEQARSFFYMQKDGADFDFNVWSSESDFFPLSEPRYFVPIGTESFWATRWAKWYTWGGYYGDPRVKEMKSAVAPAQDDPIYEAYTVYEKAIQAPTIAEQAAIFRRALEIAADNTWTIGIAEAPPQLVVVKDGFKNVPPVALYSAVQATPSNAGCDTYFFEKPNDSPGTIAETKDALENVVPRPRHGGVGGTAAALKAAQQDRGLTGALIRYTLLAIVLAAVALAAFRHPYIARRLLLMVPTLAVISIVVFIIIQLPPGDFLTARIVQYTENGDESALKGLEDLKQIFHYDDPAVVRYGRWMGFKWFVTFDARDQGLLQGHMGRSMETGQPVNTIVGDRITLTILMSLGTILFTWALAIPIGIYSAVRQYSLGDYALTLIGFVGMSVPSFLLALVLMALANVSGLFAPEFAAQPEWTWAKVLDLCRHLWVPVLVLGVGGTAGMIRIMRANLLDELKKPYVTTARAKGVRPLKLLLKYPVRIALNPFVSGIGQLFPQLVSGGAIVSMVLALPTVGPLMLDALFNQDTYLAGSMLMVMSLLGVLGTLVSDLLLLWLDPRIRYEGGTR